MRDFQYGENQVDRVWGDWKIPEEFVNLGMGGEYDHTGRTSFVNEPGSAMRFYSSQEEQELERLREDMSRTDTEKFHRLMGLMKLGRMMKKAVIHHKE